MATHPSKPIPLNRFESDPVTPQEKEAARNELNEKSNANDQTAAFSRLSRIFGRVLSTGDLNLSVASGSAMTETFYCEICLENCAKSYGQQSQVLCVSKPSEGGL